MYQKNPPANNKKNISCVVLVYENLNVIFSSLSFLKKYNNDMDIHVIENKSITTEVNEPYIRSLVDSGQIKSYFLFENNITNNAYDVILRDHDEVFGNTHTIITDGDVIADDGWLEESTGLLDKYSDLFCCSVRMKTDGWAENVKVGFNLLSRTEHPDWIEMPSGIWLCLFRSAELKAVTAALRDSELRFRDAYLHAYSSRILGKKWGTTKRSFAQELNRSLYSNSEYIIRKNKNISTNFSGDHYRFWGHDGQSSYVKFEKSAMATFDPLPLPVSRPNAERVATDAMIHKVNDSVGMSCWLDVDRTYARQNWVNVGRFGPKSFRDASTNTFYIACDVVHELPPFDCVFDHVYCYLLLGRLPQEKISQIFDFICSIVSSSGSVRLVELDTKYIEDLVSKNDVENLKLLASATPKTVVEADTGSLGTRLLDYWLTARGRRWVDPQLLIEKFHQHGFDAEIGHGNPAIDPNGLLNRFCWSVVAKKKEDKV